MTEARGGLVHAEERAEHREPRRHDVTGRAERAFGPLEREVLLERCYVSRSHEEVGEGLGVLRGSGPAVLQDRCLRPGHELRLEGACVEVLDEELGCRPEVRVRELVLGRGVRAAEPRCSECQRSSPDRGCEKASPIHPVRLAFGLHVVEGVDAAADGAVR